MAPGEVRSPQTHSETADTMDLSASRVSMSSASASRRKSGSTKRGLTDQDLVGMAMATEAAIQWSDIFARTGGSRWKRFDAAGAFTIYSKQENRTFAVLAVGDLPCSVQEITRLLYAADGPTFLANMESLYCSAFQDGALVHRVPLRRTDWDEESELVDLTVKTALFRSSGWHRPHESWAFIDATYRRSGGHAFEKLSTTLPPSSSISSRYKSIHDVTTAFSVQPLVDDSNPDGQSFSTRARQSKETRVCFYAAFTPPELRAFSLPAPPSPFAKVIKQRLITMAKSCGRLMTLVRRRRLGVQVLVDRRILAMGLTGPSLRCVCCNKSTNRLMIKQCRLCGKGVCSECSHKHERETKVRGGQRIRLEMVRICDLCLDRIDQSDFSELNDASLLGPMVHPNAPNEPEASTALKNLLKDELLHAQSPDRQASVMNVIKYVLEEEKSSSVSSNSRSREASSRSQGGDTIDDQPPLTDVELVEALEALRVRQVPYNEAELMTTHGRPYVIDSSNPDQALAAPRPENEAARLRAIEEMRVQELVNNSDELNLICSLAAKEMGTFASVVTIIMPDKEQVVAANLDKFQTVTFPRNEGFCAHTIMDDKPHVIPHPEADMRFNQSGSVKDLGIRYYCGFPIRTDDDVVIGALCCVNTSTQAVSETQFNTMKKLAETAGKVIQVHGKQQQGKPRRIEAPGA